MIKVVLDAMGGDYAPRAVIDGALLSLERGHLDDPQQIVLAGPEVEVRQSMEDRGMAADHFPVVDAPDVLEGNESPVEATKKRTSIAIGISEIREGRADAFISAGNTGLVVATATLNLPRLEGIRRVGIAATIVGEKGPFICVDVGANPQPKPIDLLHCALMGSAYYHDTFGIERPRVGLLNIGSEDQKGTQLVKEGRSLLRGANVNFDFTGNVEGVEVFAGACDVVVCDGFTGNVLLKVSEGVAEYMLRSVGRFMAEAGVDAVTMDQVLSRAVRNVDFSEYGGALLLGVDGIVTICHGRSQGPALCNAIRFATRAVGAKVNQHIVNAARAASATT